MRSRHARQARAVRVDARARARDRHARAVRCEPVGPCPSSGALRRGSRTGKRRRASDPATTCETRIDDALRALRAFVGRALRLSLQGWPWMPVHQLLPDRRRHAVQDVQPRAGATHAAVHVQRANDQTPRAEVLSLRPLRAQGRRLIRLVSLWRTWFWWRSVPRLPVRPGDRVQLTNGDWCTVLEPPADYGGQLLVKVGPPDQPRNDLPHMLAPLRLITRRRAKRW